MDPTAQAALVGLLSMAAAKIIDYFFERSRNKEKEEREKEEKASERLYSLLEEERKNNRELRDRDRKTIDELEKQLSDSNLQVVVLKLKLGDGSGLTHHPEKKEG